MPIDDVNDHTPSQAPPPHSQTGLGRSEEPSSQSEGANSYQHGGSHYKGSGYEHWDFVLDTGQHYLQACGTKYITRARKHKGGPLIQWDKCLHYIHKTEEAEGQGRFINMASCGLIRLAEFARANNLTTLEATAISMIIQGDWKRAREAVQRLRTELVPQGEAEVQASQSTSE